MRIAAVDEQREHGLAERLGMGDLSEAPLGFGESRAAQGNERAAAAQLGIEPSLPLIPSSDSLLWIGVQKHGPKAFTMEPLLEIQRLCAVPTRIADEDATHAFNSQVWLLPRDPACG